MKKIPYNEPFQLIVWCHDNDTDIMGLENDLTKQNIPFSKRKVGNGYKFTIEVAARLENAVNVHLIIYSHTI